MAGCEVAGGGGIAVGASFLRAWDSRVGARRHHTPGEATNASAAFAAPPVIQCVDEQHRPDRRSCRPPNWSGEMKFSDALTADMPLLIGETLVDATPIAYAWELRNGGLAWVNGGHQMSTSAEAHVGEGTIEGEGPWDP